ncbi:MAG: NAD(P)-dependent oxidoreductase [Chloroflexota bacterium]
MANLPRLGFIGLGRMGAPMCGRLLDAGYAITVFDVRVESMEGVLAKGAVAASSPAEVVLASDVIITIVPDPPAVEAVMDGELGVLSALGAGQILLEMTTSAPLLTRRLADDVKERGARILDAPVSGGVRGAESGKLAVMVGGDAALFEECRPIFEQVGSYIVHAGPNPGDGHTAKLMNNLLSVAGLLASAEVLALGMRAGLDPERLTDIINHSTGRTYSTEIKFPRDVFSGTYNAGFTVAQYLKDVNLAQDLADALRVPIPMGALAKQLWLSIISRDGPDIDHTAAVRSVARLAGLEDEALTPRGG